MAHSGAMTGEINYFFQDKNGKVLKVLKPVERKPSQQHHLQDTRAGSTTVFATSSSSMGAFNQINTTSQPQYVRMPASYSIQPAENSTFTVIPSRGSSGSSTMKAGTDSYDAMNYDESDSTVTRQKDRFTKLIPNNNAKTKLKLSSTNSVQRKRKPEKAGKGLRHFSMKVCEKVREKVCTTYNEVADELVAEEIQNNSLDSSNCDQKNIRRRVYDALNVLMAMQIISKDKKEIRWIGLPTQTSSAMEKENEERRERIKQKHQQLRELILQQVAFKSLIERNKEAESNGIIPTPNSSIQLPFITVNTHKATKINCSVTNDKSEYVFKFDDKFEMHDDAEVLKRMGLLFDLDKGQCSNENIERAKALVPPNFEKYIEAYGKGDNYDSDDDISSYVELNNDSQGFSRLDAKSEIDEDEELLDNSDVD